MAGSPEKSGGLVDKGLGTWQKFNKFTLVAELGTAVFVPALAAPALVLATIDIAQMVAINEIQKNRKKSNPHTGLKAENRQPSNDNAKVIYKKAA